jgi:hypothetical protein
VKVVLLVALAGCARVPEAIAWERLEHRGKSPQHDTGSLTDEERKFVEECDRFVADFPQSVHRQHAAFAAARVLHAHGTSEEATPRLMALAAADPPDPELCVLARNLVLDLDNARGDWPALQRHAAALEQSPCATRGRANPHLPQFAGDGVNDPSLDQLGFLDGCWQYFHIDWGFGLCWHREGARWVGLADTFGPMERKPSAVGLQIAHGASGLVFSAGTNASLTLFDGLEAAPMTGFTASQVTFGTHALSFTVQGDTLTVRRPAQEFRLHRTQH